MSTSKSISQLPGPRHRDLSIFTISVLGLFVELMLIRWIATEVRIFAYLQNTILIVCFLGLGIGCFTCRQPVNIRRALWSLFGLAAILAIPFTRDIAARITDLLSVLSDFLIWEEAVSNGLANTVFRVILGIALTFVLMVLVWEIFLPIGRILGRLMDEHPKTLWAYSINIVGSLLGIWLFVAFSGLSLPPIAWMLATGALFIAYIGRGQERWTNLGILAATMVATWFASTPPGAMECKWSPYQKLVLYDNKDPKTAWLGQYLIKVNNVGYQGIVDLSEQGIAKNPGIDPELAAVSQYDIPLRFKPNPEHVLIVGAGSGNDAAGALRGGAQRVTAVDIDPVIIDMGRRHHPEHPYDSDRVHLVNDDARSFFASTDEKYDLIIFGLLDSHTTTSMTNARLDHYVYTAESIARARSLLKEGGVMSLTFMVHRQYIADRINRCLTEVFGRAPLVFIRPTDSTGWGGVMFITGDEQSIARALEQDTKLAAAVKGWQQSGRIELTGRTRLATDDWPYIYLDRPRIPSLFIAIAGLMLCMLAYARHRCSGSAWLGKWRKSEWHFFFLGAAFLLLEVQNISKASVVLGNTWIVNAVVISGILIMILFANLIAARFPRLSQVTVGALLIGSCLLLYTIDLSTFAFLPFATKAVVVGLLTTLPMLFAGIIFIDSFTRVDQKDKALGANLIGSLVGGMLQCLTFVLGIKALLLIVAGLYCLALWTRPQSRRRIVQPTEGRFATGSPDAKVTFEETAEPAELVGCP